MIYGELPKAVAPFDIQDIIWWGFLCNTQIILWQLDIRNVPKYNIKKRGRHCGYDY